MIASLAPQLLLPKRDMGVVCFFMSTTLLTNMMALKIQQRLSEPNRYKGKKDAGGERQVGRT